MKIRELREKKQMTREDLWAKLDERNMRVSMKTIERWENGKSIKLEYAKAVADVLNVKLENLL